MEIRHIVELLIFITMLCIFAPLFGMFAAKVMEGKRTILHPVFGWLERGLYRIGGIDPGTEMSWKTYALSLLLFNGAGFIIMFLILLFQKNLPLNQPGAESMSWHLALNTAVSFVTNTNWQAYSGEAALSWLAQTAGCTVQNFLSAAAGIAVLAALSRAFRRSESPSIGNFWADCVRSFVYILLPISMIAAVLLISQGVIQNFHEYAHIRTLEGIEQIIPSGPAASQIAIKQIGTNGGGFFGVNSAHPFENPTPVSNFIELLSIFLIPSALVFMFGWMIGSRKQALVIFAVMMTLFIGGLSLAVHSELGAHRVHQSYLMEGKEVRFGKFDSTLWDTATTCASSGSTNSALDSASPLTGLVMLFNMMTGEIIFGGVGSGMYGMLMYAILTIFIAGLMVGRTPEYLGKKIGSREIKMASIALLIPGFSILTFSGIACLMPAGLSSLGNGGPHGLTEILYAFTSASQNNGSSFGGLSTNTVFYNLATAAAMLTGRYAVIIPVLALTGSVASQKTLSPSEGTFRTDTAVFGIFLLSVIMIVGALTFFPALALGPVLDHLLLTAGHLF
jgi:K+-transporting ATPase ATPase A chain